MKNKQTIRLAVIIICIYLIVTTTQAIWDMGRGDKKLTDRQAKVQVLKEEQEKLLAQKAAINKPGYWEKVARDQLGLSKPGEQIIIIPRELLVNNDFVATPDATPNWKKWVKLIF